MIQLVNVCKSFDGRQVLKNISVTFEAGKTNLIIGKSGSGKTVLMKSMVGLHEIESGGILFSDRSFSKMDFQQRKEIRKEIGMVFQGGALFDSLNVEENVMFPLSIFTTMSLAEKKQRVEFCLERVNLYKVGHLFPSEISGGMKKRVAIARAIAMKPKYLFCDEPNSGLDPQTSIVIDKLIYEITKEYTITTIINTHDMNSVMEIGDKIVYIHQGERWWEGNSQSLLTTNNEEVIDFVYAYKYMKKMRPNS